MIIHHHKCIFIHVPKTGGKSICAALGVRNRMHRKASTYTGKQSRHYQKFAFVRNPWDRFVSAYNYLLKGGEPNIKDHRDSVEFIRGMGFDNFVENCQPAVQRQTHFKPQYTWLDTSHISLGRFENLNNDFDNICEKLRIPGKDLPHINKTPHRHYTEYYNDKTRRIIAELYKNDIEYFGYKFER